MQQAALPRREGDDVVRKCGRRTARHERRRRRRAPDRTRRPWPGTGAGGAAAAAAAACGACVTAAARSSTRQRAAGAAAAARRHQRRSSGLQPCAAGRRRPRSRLHSQRGDCPRRCPSLSRGGSRRGSGRWASPAAGRCIPSVNHGHWHNRRHGHHHFGQRAQQRAPGGCCPRRLNGTAGSRRRAPGCVRQRGPAAGLSGSACRLTSTHWSAL